MFSLVCPKCAAGLQVPNSLAGCLIRCHDCDAVTRAPFPEQEDDASGKTSYDVQSRLDPSPAGTKDIQDFVKEVEQKAREEAERKPYHRGEVQVDLIAGILLIVGGLLLAWAIRRGMLGVSVLPILIFGTIALVMFLSGLVCLLIWFINRRW